MIHSSFSAGPKEVLEAVGRDCSGNFTVLCHPTLKRGRPPFPSQKDSRPCRVATRMASKTPICVSSTCHRSASDLQRT